MSNKEYTDIIEAMTALATPASTRNKLNKILVRTEDHILKNAIPPVINLLDSSNVRIKVTVRTTQEPHAKLFKYCKSVIASKKPQWQILAEKNGWGPIK